jgi:hypothetical protein
MCKLCATFHHNRIHTSSYIAFYYVCLPLSSQSYIKFVQSSTNQIRTSTRVGITGLYRHYGTWLACLLLSFVRDGAVSLQPHQAGFLQVLSLVPESTRDKIVRRMLCLVKQIDHGCNQRRASQSGSGSRLLPQRFGDSGRDGHPRNDEHLYSSAMEWRDHTEYE